jgi:hypothetical protein
MRWLLPIVIAGCMLNLAAPKAAAEDKIEYCATGQMTLGPFKEHIAYLRKSNRYSREDIDGLIKQERQGGPEFYSSQIITKEEQSGSGDFDLHLFHGHSDPHTTYKSEKKWSCEHDDYPVIYFVGFKVTEIRDGAILVSRTKGTVNVISLKKLDPDLDKHTKVRDAQTQAVLCQDIAVGCSRGIFYGQW